MLDRRTRIQNIVVAITFVYLAGLICWLILWLLFGDATWWLLLLNRFAPLLFLPVVVLFPLALLTGLRRFALIFLLPVILFVLLYRPFILPVRLRPVAQTQSEFRVASYNILYSNRNTTAIADVIKDSDADVVGLQEVQPDTFAALQDHLTDSYPHSFLAEPNPYGTTAIFSRYPLRDAQTVPLGVDRPAAVAIVDMQGQALVFASAHLQPFGLHHYPLSEKAHVTNVRIAQQMAEAEMLLHALEQVDLPAVVTCDCNSQELNDTIRFFGESMQNAARSGWSLLADNREHPPDRDLTHLDYVFADKAFDVIGVSIWHDSGGSDHRPIIARLIRPK
jgi:endonuclease/exonuclease/phosphatase family metal-dependent hydrolase